MTETLTADVNASELLTRWQSQDDGAATLLFERYVDRLLRMVKRQLTTRLNSRLDEADVVQTVFRTFFRRAQQVDADNPFHFNNDEDLWRLLVTIALCKTRKAVRRHTALKRDVRRDTSMDASSASTLEISLLSRSPNHEDAVMFADSLESLSLVLTSRQAEIIRQRMQGYELSEIAAEMCVSERTIGREMSQIRQRMEWIATQSATDVE